MADNEVKIRVLTEVDKTELDELDETVEDIRDKSEIDVEVEVDDTSVQEADSNAEQLNEDLDEIDGKEVSPTVDTSGLDEAIDKTEETSSALDSLTTAAAGIGLGAGLEQMISTADRINTSWNQLDLTFAGTGVSMDALKTKANELSSATGRSGGIIRDYFNQMGIAGVTNTNLLASSFEALSGKSYQTGNSIEMMESKMQTMVLSGNASSRMLKSLGLSAEDLAQVMGVSADQVSEAFKNMTPEERLAAITKAMGDGARANEMYKNSYEGLKTQAETAMAGLMGAVGQAILPVIVPALQAATTGIKMLTDGFKSLPGPVQAIIGGVAGFAAIALTVVGVLGTLGQMVSMVKGGLEALNLITKLSAVYNKAAAAAQWLLNIAMSANPVGILIIAIAALVAILTYLYFTNENVRNTINGIGEAIMGVLAPAIDSITAAFNDFTNALGLNTNNWIEAVMGFILFIPQLPMVIGNALAEALMHALGFDGTLTEYLGQAATNAYQAFSDGIDGLRERLQEELDGMIQDATDFSNGLPPIFNATGIGMVSNWIFSTGEHSPGFMYDAFHGELLAMLTYAATFLATLPSRLGSAARNAVSNFASGIRGLASHLSSELSAMLNAALSFTGQIGSILWNAGVNAITGFLNGLDRHSPGKMQREFIAEITEMGERVPEESRPLIRNVTSLGENLVGSFNGDLGGIEFGNARLVNGSNPSSPGSVVNLTLNVGNVDKQERVDEIIEAVRNYFYWDNTTAGRTN